MYEEARTENPNKINENKNIDSMKDCFKRLNENTNKWIVACKEAHGRKRSGMSQQDDSDVFNEVMSKYPKWGLKLDHDSTCFRAGDEKGNEESDGSSKRSRTSEDGSGSTTSCPTYRDKAEEEEKQHNLVILLKLLQKYMH
ncbi:hypothetical protein ACS0TY_032300 [Phlomoides rotata]